MQKRAVNIFERFKEISLQYKREPALYYKEKDFYQSLLYEDLLKSSLYLGKILLKNKLNKGQRVSIILENSPCWAIAYLGVIFAGGTAVPLDPQLPSSLLKEFITHSNSKSLITSPQLFKKFNLRIKIPTIELELKKILKESRNQTLEAEPIIFSPNQIASLLYTSGTTDIPKGVMLTHKNLLANVDSLQKLNLLTSQDCLISILPLYHIYPFMVNMLLPLLSGAKISYPPTIESDRIFECMQKTGVTILTGVPRIFTLFYERINEKINALPLPLKLALKFILPLNQPLRKLNLNISKSVMAEVHKKFGRNLRFMISGGAKLHPQVAKQLYLWGFSIYEGYGLTETSPVVTFNRPGDFKFGSAGKPIEGVKVKIASPDEKGRGEITVKGENVMLGYFRLGGLTKNSIKEGWFYTGDIGYFDREGFLHIIGRKKEIIVLSSGKNINPEDLENYYSQSPFIKEICIFESQSPRGKKDFLEAVILPDFNYFQSQGVVQIKEKIRWEIENLSRGLAPYQRISKYTIINKELPRTPLGKIKRYEVKARYWLSEKKEEKQEAQNLEILSGELSQKAFNFLCNKLKRQVELDDHLELDLGLDSLDQVELFLGFQKATGIKISNEEALGIFTVRDALLKLNEISQKQKEEKETVSTQWQSIFKEELPSPMKNKISLRQNNLAKAVNLTGFFILKILFKLIFRLKVEGKENIPSEGPFLICPNHTSYLDGFIIAGSVPFKTFLNTYFLGHTKYFEHPYVSWATKVFRLLSIDPLIYLVESMQACAYLLKNKKILCIFPEGVRSNDGKIQNFKKGSAILSKELNIEIIPVIIEGAFSAWPRYRRFPEPSRIKVFFGKKINPSELLSEKEMEATDVYQIMVEKLRKKMLELAADVKKT